MPEKLNRKRSVPEGADKSVISFFILDVCRGCGLCKRRCPEGAIQGEPKKLHVITPEKCSRCGTCYEICPFDSIEIRGMDLPVSGPPAASPAAQPGEPECTRCGLCVTVCQTYGRSALSMVGTGEEEKVVCDAERCVGCAACARACPTGFIRFTDRPGTRSIWGRDFERGVCSVCRAPLPPKAQLDFIAERTGFSPEVLGSCDLCKKRQTAGLFARLIID